MIFKKFYIYLKHKADHRRINPRGHLTAVPGDLLSTCHIYDLANLELDLDHSIAKD